MTPEIYFYWEFIIFIITLVLILLTLACWIWFVITVQLFCRAQDVESEESPEDNDETHQNDNEFMMRVLSS